MEESVALPRVNVFWIIWCGQLISIVGSGLTAFALGIWVYQHTGEVAQFGIVATFAVLPGILLAPFAGALVDRWDRRTTLILSDLGGALSTLALVLLIHFGKLELWQIYIAVCVDACCTVFRWPALLAATSLLVPGEQLGRTNGLAQIAQAGSKILSPVIAGALMVAVGLSSVLFVDFITFLFAIATLLIVQIPLPSAIGEPTGPGNGALLKQISYGWAYVVQRPGLLGLMVFFALTNLLIGLVTVLVTPMVLNYASAAVLGTVVTIGGSGLLAGGLAMSIWGGPRPRIYGVLGFEIMCGFTLIAAGIRPSLVVLTVAAFLFFFSLQIINGSAVAILQAKVAPDVQGRIFSLCGMIASSSAPLAFLLAGPLADRVFEPLLLVHGVLANSVGRIIGVGPGRGIGLMFIISGLLTILLGIGGFFHPKLKNLEKELPDLGLPQLVSEVQEN
jgi:hypothetical protein